MTDDNQNTTCIDLQKRISEFQIGKLRSDLAATDLGSDAYQILDIAKSVQGAEPIRLCVPIEWLDIRWDKLHDGYQYLALQQPLALVLTDQPPPPPIVREPLRVLLTIAPVENADIADDLILSQFAERVNRLIPNRERIAIDLTIEREIRGSDFVDLIKTAQANGEEFHVWHHVGSVRPTAEGFALRLADSELKSTVLQTLVGHHGSGNIAGLRMFLLHTLSITPSLLPVLTDIPASTLVGLTMGPQSDMLLNGLYLRLLSNDVATAAFLARLDCYISNPAGDHWATLEVLSRTRPLRMVASGWRNQLRSFLPNDHKPCFLFLRANPIDAVSGMLPLDREIKDIKAELGYRRGELDIYDEGALEVEDFSKLLLEKKPHLLHFSGHGTTSGSLVWETHDSKKAYVQLERIAPLLNEFRQIRCVILNACYSSKMAERLRSYGIVVIGMSDQVTNNAASHFARGLYRALAHGETLARAFDLARHEISLAGFRDEAGTPQISDYTAAKQIRFFEQESI